MNNLQFGRLQAALASATNEVTVAAANINFDFTVVKYEAPREYQPIGGLLSTSRKHDAESGRSHVTARRLAALFDGVCPDTPNLITAFGKRVSAISKVATQNESKEFTQSMFSNFAGIDATSIWAAATSSDKSSNGGALHVHLLASMLAKIWDPPEAVSIWDEFVRCRRRQIADQLEKGDEVPFALAAAAAQQEISRTQLAEWDASARAWGKTADAIMAKELTQLRLILDNVELSVKSDGPLPASVTEAWVKALTVMERLVSGVPQEIHDGASLLGLAAWHLYPDIHVFGVRNVQVPMNDDLVKTGGVLILGCSPSASTPSNGITWSLSLAHLKFYGRPVQSCGTVVSSQAYLTFDELIVAAFGSILRVWKIPLEKMLTVAKIINNLSLKAPEKVFLVGRGHDSRLLGTGLKLLSAACDAFIRDPDRISSCLNLGINRPLFIPDSSPDSKIPTVLRLFGYLQDDHFCASLKSGDAQVAFLRRVGARALGSENDAREGIIAYHQEYDPLDSCWATLRPIAQKKAGRRKARKREASHCRWGDTRRQNIQEEVHFANNKGEVHWLYDAGKAIKKEKKGTTQFQYWYGRHDKCAIYINAGVGPMPTAPTIEVEDVLWAVQNDLIDIRFVEDNVSRTLITLGIAFETAFRYIQARVIRPQILSVPLVAADFLESRSTSGSHVSSFGDSFKDDLASTMCALSYFISGTNISMGSFTPSICGVSFGDSIYVPKKLLCDPLEACENNAIVRILGNIGRPGFAIFSSVQSPMVPEPDEASWRVLNTHLFNGKAEDAFASTSLHLSFTDWERAVNSSAEVKGIRDVQHVHLESVVSIRDAGRWVGDVDIVRAIQYPHVIPLPPQTGCTHRQDEKPSMSLTSVETWDELRNTHSGNVVVRAHGNWTARLAIAAFLSQGVDKREFLIEHIVLCPPKMCWKCVDIYGPCVFIF